MSFVVCVRPGRIYHIRRHGYRHMKWGAHVIRRSILFALPYSPICLAGLLRFPVLWYFWSGAGVRLELRAERPLCRGHGVADRAHLTLVMWVWLLPPLVGVAAYALGNSWRGVRVYTLRLPGPQSICWLASLGQL